MRPEPVPSHVIRRRFEREQRLRKLGYADYDSYIASSHWAAVKARYRESDEPQDCICGATERLQLHHLTYERVGKEELVDLTPLCGECHTMVHTLERRGEIALDFAGFVSETRAARYAKERPKASDREFTIEDRAKLERRVRAKLRDACLNLEKQGRSTVPLFDAVTELISPYLPE